MQIISYLKKKKVVCTSAIIENKKIARNDIEKHLMLFHKFINSENENFCEVCDTGEIFNTSKDLLEPFLMFMKEKIPITNQIRKLNHWKMENQIFLN